MFLFHDVKTIYNAYHLRYIITKIRCQTATCDFTCNRGLRAKSLIAYLYVRGNSIPYTTFKTNS